MLALIQRQAAKPQRRRERLTKNLCASAPLRLGVKILAILALAMLSCSCGKKKEPPQRPSFPVQLTAAQKKDVPIFIETLGHVDPIISIDIRSRIEGELTGVYFQQGQEVRKDDLLFTIDPKPYEAALKQAQATLEQNNANFALSLEKVKRYQTLAREEFYSQIDYETLQVDYAANIALVKGAEAQVDNALINLDYCWIHAPVDGMIGILAVDYGNLVGNDQQTPLATLNQMAPIFVTFSIPENRLPDIQKYRRLSTLKTLVAYEHFKGEVFEGKLEILNNQVDPNTGMIQLRAVFDNESRELWPGQFVRTRLILYTHENAIVIPFTCVQMTISGPVAFVVNDRMIVERRPIKLGARQDDQIIVLEGLNEGESVVMEGQLNLSPGVKVYISRKL